MSTRPTRNAQPPPPTANALYCHTCGRIITPRKTPTTPQKYCSDRCRRQKPRLSTTGTSLETLIERTFVRLLSRKQIVECGEVERVVFGGSSGNISKDEGMEIEADDDNDDDDNDDEGGGVPLPLTLPSLPSSSISSSTSTGLSPQQRGVRKAREREMVRQAARRGVAFGFEIEEGGRRKVDCVRGGRVVESSFAKGEWGVRWRG
ncbi:hypothetical protein JMJ35_010094 [Cladonia borealis]|uniref:Uncharacterized protein n=1 Tax=Cladonia borealis TaxID=184061 RepID=A0AA39QSD4_9LECA|nr:hypothetical protein JMJ35_010094 [Cladonia borealis]